MKSFRYKIWLLIAALFGGSAVAMGAFGAHGLEASLRFAEADGGVGASRKLANWETAARYQMYHALALLAVGMLAARRCTLCIHLAGTAFTLGVLIFSGCLYALVLNGPRWLGGVVPIGGVLLIVGWICLAVAALRFGEAASAACGTLKDGGTIC